MALKLGVFFPMGSKSESLSRVTYLSGQCKQERVSAHNRDRAVHCFWHPPFFFPHPVVVYPSLQVPAFAG
jgi:hypothetical protein